MTLDEYLTDVSSRNGGVRGTKMSSEAGGLRLNEGPLFFHQPDFLESDGC